MEAMEAVIDRNHECRVLADKLSAISDRRKKREQMRNIHMLLEKANERELKIILAFSRSLVGG